MTRECVYFVGVLMFLHILYTRAGSLTSQTQAQRLPAVAQRRRPETHTEQYGVHDASCGPKDAPPKIARMFSHIHMNAIASSTEHSSFGFKGKRIILRSPSTLATL